MIETERLSLTPAVEAEIATIMEIENHPDNRDFIMKGTYEQHLAEIASPDVFLLAVKAKDDGRIVGFVLLCLDRIAESLEFRRLAVTEKGGGFGREVCGAVIRHAFEGLGVNRLWLDVCHDNAVGIALYEKLGMHLDGVLRESCKAERGFLSQRIYSVLKAEYPEVLSRLR